MRPKRCDRVFESIYLSVAEEKLLEQAYRENFTLDLAGKAASGLQKLSGFTAGLTEGAGCLMCKNGLFCLTFKAAWTFHPLCPGNGMLSLRFRAS